MTGPILKTSPDLHALAEALGVRIVRHDGGIPAWYHHDSRTISTRRGQSIELYRSSLAHELGHAFYGHLPSDDLKVIERQERQADRFAASLLLDEESVRIASLVCDDQLAGMADELEVTEELLAFWWQMHHPDRPLPERKYS